MRKLILMWLFKTDDIKDYFELLRDYKYYIKRHADLIDNNISILEKWMEDLYIMRKLIKICENHEIDIDEEIKYVEL